MKECRGILVRHFLLLGIVSTACSMNLKRNAQSKFEPGLGLIPGKDSFQYNYITYFMYNITNPDEFEAGEKPVLEQVGPYVYKETRRRFNVTKISDSLLGYSVDRFWEFVPEMSEGHEETDEVNVVNIPMIILANKLSAKRLPKAFNDILVDELTEKGESLVRRNEEIGNILYYGMNVTIYTEILADVLQGNVPPEFQDGIFSLFKGKNGTVEGTFTVSTKPKDFGDILSFNNKSQLSYWSGDFCNKIEGTDGYFFRPGINEESTLKIFYPELCRSVYLKWSGMKEMDGVPVGRFSFPEDMLEDPEKKPENKCFCSTPANPTNNTKDGCLKKGFIDYASCKQDSPLLVSYPHFLYADPIYGKKLEGLTPNPEEHESEFLVEPTTGTILRGMRKFQFNVKLQPLDNVEVFRNVSFMIVPVFVVHRQIILPENKVERLKQDLKTIEDPPKAKSKDNEIAKKEKPADDENETANYQSDQPKEEVQAEPEPETATKETTKDENYVNIEADEEQSDSQSVTFSNGSSNDFSMCLFIIVSIVLFLS